MIVLRNATVFIVCALLNFSVFGGETAEIKSIKPSYNSHPGLLGPEWSYREGYEELKIGVGFNCRVDEVAYIDWPVVECTEPLIEFEVSGLSEAYLSVGDLTLKAVSYSSRSLYSVGMGQDVYRSISGEDDPEITLITKPYFDESNVFNVASEKKFKLRLLDFKSQADRYLSERREFAESDLGEKRMSWYMTALAWVIGVPVGVFLTYKFLVFFRKVFPAVKDGVLMALSNTLRFVNDRRIRSVVIDESIRQSTREEFSKAREDEKAMFRRHIKEAVDRGDTETARVLISVLERDAVRESKLAE